MSERNSMSDTPDDDPIDHLWNAASEFLRAMRGLLDAADEFVESQRAKPRADDSDDDSRLHRIDIDAS